MAERLQKILANTGLGSRRQLEALIADGGVRLNGQTAKLGDRAQVDDDLVVDGRFYRVVSEDKSARRVIMYHKPTGEVTSRKDPECKRTVFDRLPNLHNNRWVSVGRLDINTLGLLLLTSDGQLANALMHPSSEIEREYAVRINGKVSDEMIERLRQGVELEDGLAKFDRLVDEGGEGVNHWFRAFVGISRCSGEPFNPDSLRTRRIAQVATAWQGARTDAKGCGGTCKDRQAS